jgi:adenylate cyclase
VDTPNHASLAVKTAIEMATAVRLLNEEHKAKGIPEIGFGFGLRVVGLAVALRKISRFSPA